MLQRSEDRGGARKTPAVPFATLGCDTNQGANVMPLASLIILK
jgi:hypothetical protein